MNVVLAHYGGLDEIGVFLIPALVAIMALRRVERKAREREAEEAMAADPEPADPTSS
ncbi:MAG: hypothetical protein Q8Q52_05385 [Acidimicrobiia bacterium]|nr:hypothetical protein [Acidimicrobiia bacterium]